MKSPEINFLNIISNADNDSYSERSESFINNDKLKSQVKYTETNTHFYIKNFPATFGDRQNKNNRIYEWQSLVYAANWFNLIKKNNPYFCYMFDGHKDDDSYKYIIGRIESVSLDHTNKVVLLDIKINKGAESQPIIKNIILDGDPIGISMRILTPNSITVNKDAVTELNPNVVFIEDEEPELAELVSADEIEYISGNAYIWRFDLTWFPSFNGTFVDNKFVLDPKLNRSESSINAINKLRKSATFFKNSNNCVTNACQFRYTIKDFVDLISRDESIVKIKENPDLYNSMIDFSYINLDWFNFDKIDDITYLEKSLKNSKITKESVVVWQGILEKILPKNIINYIILTDKYDIIQLNNYLYNTLIKLSDEDNIFYQTVTINYLHFVLLSSLILLKKSKNKVKQNPFFTERLEDSITSKNINSTITTRFIRKIKKEMCIYDYINIVFVYIYDHIEKFSDKTAPITILDELKQISNIRDNRGIKKKQLIKK